MFGLFKKDPSAKLKAQYSKLLEQAMQAQRSGDIEGYSKLTDKAEALLKEIDQLEASNS